MKRANLPWNSPTARIGDRRSWPKKAEAGRPEASCRWPAGSGGTGAVCGSRSLVKGVVLCTLHAKVLDQAIGQTCAWPGCMQTSVYMPLCSYHTKVAKGLLDPHRPCPRPERSTARMTSWSMAGSRRPRGAS